MRIYSKLTAGLIMAAVSYAGAGTANAFTPASTIKQPAMHSDITLIAAPKKMVDEKFKRRVVRLVTDEQPGTVIVDTQNKFLYYVEGRNKATRYGIGVGRDGFGWSEIGRAHV